MYVRTHRGLGDAQSAAQTFARTSQLGIGTGSAVAGALTSSAGPLAGATILGMAPAVAIPVIGAALVGVTFAVTKLIQNSGCGPTCIQATEYANKSADLMQQNVKAYFSLAAPRPRSAQVQALANFDALWQQLVQLCSDPKLGNAGKRCISERQPGGKYDDARFNRDPIAQDPDVYDDSQPVPGAGVISGARPASSSAPGGSLSTVLLLGALGLAAVWAFS